MESLVHFPNLWEMKLSHIIQSQIEFAILRIPKSETTFDIEICTTIGIDDGKITCFES